MKNANTLQKMTFEAVYLDYVNNFLTISAMAEHYGENPEFLEGLIKYGRIYNRYKSFCEKAKHWKR